MAWYPGATKRELQPESDNQSAIRPTQFILHSIAAPWTANRVYEYWRDSTNLESHFGLGYEGDLAQFIGTHTRADATGAANLRADGTGAVSLESASNLEATDPWTAAQVEEIIRLGVWLHQTEDIPLRICRTAADPGYAYHRMFSTWNPNGHSCPGPARVKQFHDVIFPGILARANGATIPSEEDDMTPEQDARLERIENALAIKPWTYRNKAEDDAAKRKGKRSLDAYAKLTQTHAATVANAAALKALAALAGKNVDTSAVVAAVEAAIKDAVIKVDVDINGQEA